MSLYTKNDFLFQNEVMTIWNDVVSTDQFIQIERQLIIKCLRQIGLEIISFLAMLEDFQKKLWLKKKFVVSAEYCITLDQWMSPCMQNRQYRTVATMGRFRL